MKKIINIALTALVLTGVSAIPANAGEILYCQGMVCSATPPAPESFATFAVVNPQGVVQNVIVFSIEHAPSNMGSGYTACPNCQLVQQSPAGVTSGNVGTTENPVKYEAPAQVFTQGSVTTPIPVTRIETVDTATLIATIDSTEVTFGPNIPVTPVVTATTGATLSATTGLATEVIVFETPKTRSQIQASIENKLRIMQQYLNRFYVLLNGWLID